MAGDICGMENIALEGVANSGKNLLDAKFLYFDLMKTAVILAKDASGQVDQSITDIVGSNSFAGSAKDYCLKLDAETSLLKTEHVDLTTLALTPDMNLEEKSRISSFSSKMLSERRSIRLKRSLSQGNGTMEEEDFMHGILISARLYQNKSALMVFLEPEGKMKVWRTSSLSADDGQKLLDLNPVNVALTGGGACRYCVKECPDG